MYLQKVDKKSTNKKVDKQQTKSWQLSNKQKSTWKQLINNQQLKHLKKLTIKQQTKKLTNNQQTKSWLGINKQKVDN